jgi:hypothetical protein
MPVAVVVGGGDRGSTLWRLALASGEGVVATRSGRGSTGGAGIVARSHAARWRRLRTVVITTPASTTIATTSQGGSLP